ncbi:hypothetical protein, partial [Xanthomonas phaseoli]
MTAGWPERWKSPLGVLCWNWSRCGALTRYDAKAGKAPCGEPFAVDHERLSHASTFFDASRDGASACAVLASPSVAAGQDSSPLEKLRSKLVQSRKSPMIDRRTFLATGVVAAAAS